MALKAPERSSSRKSAPSRRSYLKSCLSEYFSLFFFFFTGQGKKNFLHKGGSVVLYSVTVAAEMQR